MKRNRFMEEPIIGILKEHEAGVSLADLCRKLGVSDASIYNGTPSRRDGRLRGQASEKVGGREHELKRLLTDAMLDNAPLKDLLGSRQIVTSGPPPNYTTSDSRLLASCTARAHAQSYWSILIHSSIVFRLFCHTTTGPQPRNDVADQSSSHLSHHSRRG
ncbi:transposase [Bradyrhizobium sp. 150]|uniref:transposase n=1 Tax=Bradyrhizobium sp. 150 TaxID=2782625 RepID=UPI001FF9754E|nr:transposase [Bradyrhizobium sp. 150]